jgi:hypothetical protein
VKYLENYDVFKGERIKDWLIISFQFQ